ncbi:right-handed parallel beta-helix repeat-containing protein [Roseofilum reptotaenium CS-1145]|uniref:Uncharacterized protein n=1 Tax=Roseofilum reptotaenium AO1-A TaxID=1925591 RepID=A0A1L9QVH6_9CYAN|nr:right-handed parallel beta-helix repeat-containing protein [Roseofilum reptotaenium]MDB9520284.1 right-handed parallel beta-helix repeat-containing protein [Roseofilum reptotaenium CS-1145]OJJ26678.1 hypothetical protein BI308_04690 [Roseofilum reptotaenium AO1-A]
MNRKFWRKYKKLVFSIGWMAILCLLSYILFLNLFPESINLEPLPVSIIQVADLDCPADYSVLETNPIADWYGQDAYPWSDRLPWGCVYNINDFPGENSDRQFEQAKAAAMEQGGGVIYFPAGTYQFSEDLVLDNRIILRGEPPKITEAKSDDFQPRSRLVFPEYKPQLSGEGTPNNTAFKTIRTAHPETDSDLGLVYLEINRAGVQILPDLNSAKNRNIILFGIRSNNVAYPDSRIPDRSFQEGWMRFASRFSANFKINGYEHILVANNRLNDRITDTYEQPGYKVKGLKKKKIITYAQGSRVPFDYSAHYGIAVNRSGQFSLGETPRTQPGLFRHGITIRDNWIYHTMRSGIQASGQGLVIKDNEIHDQRRKQVWTHPTGLSQPRNANTFENRGIDWSGHQVTIEGNEYEVYRHQIMDNRYWSVDGEGILIQECCGGTSVKGAVIRGNQGNAYIGIYKIPEIDHVTIADNLLLPAPIGKSNIYVSADTNRGASEMNNVRIENNQVHGNIVVKASQGGGGNTIINNQGTGESVLEFSCLISVTGNRGFEEKECQ